MMQISFQSTLPSILCFWSKLWNWKGVFLSIVFGVKTWGKIQLCICSLEPFIARSSHDVVNFGLTVPCLLDHQNYISQSQMRITINTVVCLRGQWRVTDHFAKSLVYRGTLQTTLLHDLPQMLFQRGCFHMALHHLSHFKLHVQKRHKCTSVSFFHCVYALWFRTKTISITSVINCS